MSVENFGRGPRGAGDRGGNQDFRRDNKKHTGPRINHMIRSPEVRLIGEDGTAFGVVSIDEARKIAEENGVDLVEISADAKPPVVKAIDFGKFKYMQQKKEQEAKKKQVVVQIKELQIRPNIEANDIDTKLRHAAKFFEDGDKVRLVMQFKGREMAYKEAGMEKYRGVFNKVLELGATVESEPSMQGNKIIGVAAPIKKTTPKKKEEA